MTVQKLAELAEFYGVPVSELLPGDAAPTPLVPSPKLVIDLERMGQLPEDKVGPLARYIATIQSQRGDYNGHILFRAARGPSLARVTRHLSLVPHLLSNSLSFHQHRFKPRNRHFFSICFQ